MFKCLTVLSALVLVASCSATSVPTQQSELGEAKTQAEMLEGLKHSNKVVITKHMAATWAVELSGLLNMNHPKVIAAAIEDRLEPIEIYVYTVEHPKFGTYIVDSGMSEEMVDIEQSDTISGPVKAAMNMELLKVSKTTKQLDAAAAGGIKGVFLTHIHMDHIMGLNDLGPEVPVYIGPGDAAAKALLNGVTQGSTDGLLKNVKKLNEWQYQQDGIIDVFGDGSFWALHSPGHTPGATAYLGNTESGIELMLGDATHTAWGWNNGVEPGTYSADIPASVVSLARLKNLVTELRDGNHAVKVHPGHQSLK